MGFDIDKNDDVTMSAADLASLVGERDALIAALKEMRRAIGDHAAPFDCYVTGPLTGDYFRDCVECPACSAIAMHDSALVKADACVGAK